MGERWSIVTCPAPDRASAGTIVTAVAPEPTTTIRLPAGSKSSGQNCGCTISPAKSSRPSNGGVKPSS